MFPELGSILYGLNWLGLEWNTPSFSSLLSDPDLTGDRGSCLLSVLNLEKSHKQALSEAGTLTTTTTSLHSEGPCVHHGPSLTCE